MKRFEPVWQQYCDFCNNKSYKHMACAECGKDMCCDCSDKHGAVYSSMVYFNGSGDLYLCKSCEAKLIANPTPKFTAYQNIRHLRVYIKMHDQDLDEKVKKVECAVKEFV